MPLSLSVTPVTQSATYRYHSYLYPLSHTGSSTNTSIKVFSASTVKNVDGNRASYFTPQISKVTSNITLSVGNTIDKKSAIAVGADLAIVFNPQTTGLINANTIIFDKKSAIAVGADLAIVFNPVAAGQLINEGVFDKTSASRFKPILLVNPNTLIDAYAFVPNTPQISLPRVLQVFSTAFSTTGGAAGESWS
jgi:hypothetical protein